MTWLAAADGREMKKLEQLRGGKETEKREWCNGSGNEEGTVRSFKVIFWREF